MNYVLGSTRYFGSIVRSKFIGHKTYTEIRIIMSSKPTPIHGPVQKT